MLCDCHLAIHAYNPPAASGAAEGSFGSGGANGSAHDLEHIGIERMRRVEPAEIWQK